MNKIVIEIRKDGVDAKMIRIHAAHIVSTIEESDGTITVCMYDTNNFLFSGKERDCFVRQYEAIFNLPSSFEVVMDCAGEEVEKVIRVDDPIFQPLADKEGENQTRAVKHEDKITESGRVVLGSPFGQGTSIAPIKDATPVKKVGTGLKVENVERPMEPAKTSNKIDVGSALGLEDVHEPGDPPLGGTVADESGTVF